MSSEDARPELPEARASAAADVDIVIEPRPRDLGGFFVRRVLPYAKRRTVGPFIFLDEMGPAAFPAGQGIDVRPHPHIGLATVTYLFEGEMRHRDSLGYDQMIRPGDVNWMTAGRGVAHSERTAADARRTGQTLHGIQSWVALPEADAEIAASFHHHPKASLPTIERDGATMRLIAGRAYGAVSPVRTYSPTYYLAVDIDAGAELQLPDGYAENAVYVVDGRVSARETIVAEKRMVVFRDGERPSLRAQAPSRLMLLGGAPIGPRRIWWNFVAASEERLEQARRDWSASADARFKETPFALPPGETEFIPLPDA
ncbi:MAG: pirin family protein [Parvularculaceae bacterium]|nr:pirin family protein [Parvularculaceae bacterium]